MGWFPKREADGTVLPSNLYFPNMPKEANVNTIKLKRWGPSRENRGPRQRSIYGMLAEQAMAKGWLNGERLRVKK